MARRPRLWALRLFTQRAGSRVGANLVVIAPRRERAARTETADELRKLRVLLAGVAAFLLIAAPAAAQSFTVTPTKLNLGSVKVGDVKVAKRDIVVTNTGDVPVDLSWSIGFCHKTESGRQR